jgi:hypothetical protein
MTALGKILVFVNLVFSVVVGGLVVVVFTARTNYAKALEFSEQSRKLDQASARAKLDESQRDKAEAGAKLAEALDALKKVQKDLDKQLEVNTDHKGRDQVDKLDRDKMEGTKQALQVDLQRAKADVEAMVKRLEAANVRITDLVKENSRLQSDAAIKDVEAKTATDALARMEKQYQALAKEYARLQTGGGSGTTTSLGSKNPPAEKIDGQVLQMAGEQLKLSVGSDSGLKLGHTLELFRLGAKPVYLGTVRITSLEAKVAVAKPIDKLNSTPQIGDTVSSRLSN